ACFFFQAEDGIRDGHVTGVQTCALPISFPAGIPHPADWQDAPGGALDFLVDQPPARYLYLRLRLTGGVATPLVRRIRLDFPRVRSEERRVGKECRWGRVRGRVENKSDAR